MYPRRNFWFSHTSHVAVSLRLGMFLFISPKCYFFSPSFGRFFILLSTNNCYWMPLASSSNSTIFCSSDTLLNTCILLLSGAAITLAHYALLQKDINVAKQAFLGTILLAVLFTIFQVLEYFEAPFAIFDGIYGSIFTLRQVSMGCM